MFDPATATIFVSIASYRDPDCVNTVRDLFRKAANPDRISIGICLQWVPEEDADCWPVSERSAQVRVDDVHAAESQGCCWARARAQALWQGEDTYFQIDSHMRFVEGWDRLLLEMLADCPSTQPVLSTYPLSFTPPDTFQRDTYVTVVPKMFDSGGALVMRPESAPMKAAPSRPRRTPFLGAGLLFLPAEAMRQVPYDPHLYFQGEEITLAVRLFTHGWDIFTPNRVVAYHDYTQRPARPRHWEEAKDTAELTRRTRVRLRHLLGMQRSDDAAALADLDRYGLGPARPVSAFEAFSGVDFRNRLLKPPYGGDPAEAAGGDKRAADRVKAFTRVWKAGTALGVAPGAAMLSEVAALLRFLDVRMLIDAGCGSLPWLDDIAADLNMTLGFDIVAEVVAKRSAELAERRNHAVLQGDVVIHDLPQGDALLCRDVLTHLPPDAALAALRRFRSNGSTYFLATTFPRGANTFVPAAGWQPMNLCKAPFNLPQPMMLIDEGRSGSSKALGVWKTADLPQL